MSTNTSATRLKKEINLLKNPEKAKLALRFMKTGKGEYAYGDKFLGISVPDLRKLSRAYKTLDINSIISLLRSPWHEERQLALFILVLQYQSGGQEEKNTIYKLFIDNYQYINNWDLVDSSAMHIVGAYLMNKNKQLLWDWIKSNDLWQRRIAVIATYHFIKNNRYNETLRLAKQVLDDKEDLMHKATGWMLREVGKRDVSILEEFLKQYYHQMPRTMLRYAIEKFPENKRKNYLYGKII